MIPFLSLFFPFYLQFANKKGNNLSGSLPAAACLLQIFPRQDNDALLFLCWHTVSRMSSLLFLVQEFAFDRFGSRRRQRVFRKSFPTISLSLVGPLFEEREETAKPVQQGVKKDFTKCLRGRAHFGLSEN